jgi:hypothetical protein
MARLHIVAEIPLEGRKAFWALDEPGRAAAMELFRSTGAKAVVADAGPEGENPAGWQPIANTPYYVFVFY